MDAQEYVERTERYLDLTAKRQLDDAREFVAEDCVFVFPYGRFDSLEDQLAKSQASYRRIGKTYEVWDVCEREDGTVAVYSVGTLTGENLHGVPFEGVRYIDRFEYRDGRIVLQQVWNDLAISGVLERTSTG